MIHTTTQIAGTGANDNSIGTVAWQNMGNVTANDGTVANTSSNIGSGSSSNYLVATNFGLSVDTSHTIVGVVMRYERRRTTAVVNMSDNAIRIVKGGVIGSTDRSNGDSYESGFTVKEYGSGTDLWGETLTPSDVNATNFGFAISAQVAGGGSNNPQVDYVEVTVYHDDGILEPKVMIF